MLVLFIIIISLFLIGLHAGTVKIDLFKLIFNEGNEDDKVIFDYRLTRLFAASLAGISLPVSGFLMQELLKNPLADPSILGITSASSLGVSIYIFSGIPLLFYQYNFLTGWLLIISSFLGALPVSLLLLFILEKVKDNYIFIILGFLISAFCSTIISLLQFISLAEKLKQYNIWSFANLTSLSYNQLILFAFCTIIGLILAIISTKSLQSFILGQEYALALGIDSKKMKRLLILSICIFIASTTAMLGPIVFISIIIPYFCRLLWNSTQLIYQLIFNALLGIILMLLIVIITTFTKIPLNILVTLISIPIIFIMIFNSYKIRII